MSGPTNKEVNHICETVEDIKKMHPQLKICACLGQRKRTSRKT